VQKRYQDSTGATAGAIIVNFHAAHGTTNDQVLYLRPDWKKVIGILRESLSAERTGYPGNVLSANLTRVHHPNNTERFGANCTAGEELIRHEVLPHRLLDYETPPRGKIIYHENTDKGTVTDSLLLFRIQNQIDGVIPQK
jgi:hypothetical protein